MTRSTFPSDIPREDFERIRELLESNRRKTRPRKHDLYDVFCGVLYLLSTGSAWRSLPPAFPPWRTVHEYFSQWTMPNNSGKTLLEDALLQTGRHVELARLRKESAAA